MIDIKMKIAILRNPIGIGGAEMSLTEMAVNLVRIGHEVWMHFDDGKASSFENFNKFGKLKLRCSSDAKNFFHEKSFNENWAVENLKDTDIAIIIHRHLFSEKLSDAVNKVKKKIVYCPGKNDHHVYGFTKNTLQFGKRIIPDYFIFNSKYTLNLHLNKNYPDALKEKFRHLHPPMDLKHYESYDINFLKKEGESLVDCEYFNVGIFGRIIPSKKPHSVLNIAEMVKKNNLKIRFNFIGGGKLEEEIKREVKKRNLDKYVFVHGMQNEPFKYLCSMNCILHLCEHESLSRSLRESMFFEKTIIAYNGAGNIELLSDNLKKNLFKTEQNAYNNILYLYENKEILSKFNKESKVFLINKEKRLKNTLIKLINQ